MTLFPTNATNERDAILAELRDAPAIHLSANDLAEIRASARAQGFAEGMEAAITAASGEFLDDPQPWTDDDAYTQGVTDAIGAIQSALAAIREASKTKGP